MKYFDVTLPTPAENLACDEALLGLVEQGTEGEILRFWEPAEPFVVVGYANAAAREVDLAACRSRGIPMLRRCSGGGTVVQGPGCLNYSLALRIPEPVTADPGGKQAEVPAASPLSSIFATNRFILDRHRTALATLLSSPIQIQGHTDLVVGNLKFSGNAQRRLRRSLVFHGTFLLQFDLDLVTRLLPMPSRQADYRQNRVHSEFLTNLNLPAADLKSALRRIWNANEAFATIPAEAIRELVSSKYGKADWNFKF